jgi:oligosaccharyltransferase complex subunit gamma
LIAVSFVALVKKPVQIKNETMQSMVVFLLMGFLVVLYSFLLRIFKVKQGGYPFKGVSLSSILLDR